MNSTADQSSQNQSSAVTSLAAPHTVLIEEVISAIETLIEKLGESQLTNRIAVMQQGVKDLKEMASATKEAFGGPSTISDTPALSELKSFVQPLPGYGTNSNQGEPDDGYHIGIMKLFLGHELVSRRLGQSIPIGDGSKVVDVFLDHAKKVMDDYRKEQESVIGKEASSSKETQIKVKEEDGMV